jgi:hypothetical protein
MGSTKVVFYLSDEIVATHKPIVVTVDATSTTILKIALASERSAPTWKAHGEALDEHRFHSLGMASDRGVGLVAGYHAACQEALGVRDQFHALHALCTLCRQWERKAYGAIAKEDAAAQKFDQAKSEATRQKRLHQYEQACQACEQAIAQYDPRNRLLHVLRETLQICSPFGQRRTVEAVRSEFPLLFSMIGEIDHMAIPQIMKPMQAHIDAIVVPFQQAEAIQAQLLEVVPRPA